MVSLNPVVRPNASTILREFDYSHPVFDARAIHAQGRLPSIQGRGNVWFCGAWTGYGFHEDGLRSGLDVADAIGRRAALQAGGMDPGALLAA
jgi:predicted NAD/FAD-binding protein